MKLEPIGQTVGTSALIELLGLRIIVVDDSAAQRQLLSTIIRKAGYDVTAVPNAVDALALLDDDLPTVVVCDWMMPGMSGPEFCKRLRASDRARYVYVLILTSRKENSAATHALDNGADDFLTKPVNPHELRARLRSGVRIVEMQAQLLNQKEAISTTLDELSEVYAAVERDLAQARLLQDALVPSLECHFGWFTAAYLLRPAGKVGGDLVGHFQAGPGRMGIYSMDVSGHGVASALLSARMAGMFSQANGDDGIAMARDETGAQVPRSGAAIVREINDRLLAEIDTELYLTLALVIIDEVSGEVEMVQAGHPHPILRHADGQVEEIGKGGLPVGLVPDAEYQSIHFCLDPGDQLLLHTDGFVECPLPDGEMLGEDRLMTLFAETEMSGAPDVCLRHLIAELIRLAGSEDLPDDVSAVLIQAAS